MEKDSWTIWKKILIAGEALIGLFAIWIVCTIFSIVLTMVIMKIRFGVCSVELMDQYAKYIQSGYIVLLGVCVSVFIKRLYNKYKIKE